jgi:SAM-dependent methyltransferase
MTVDTSLCVPEPSWRYRTSTRLFSLAYGALMKAREPVIRRWYDHMSRIDRDADMTLMNYGWADNDSEAAPLRLECRDEANRYSIQLYDRVAGAVELRGKDVLEVGSGRGGGASFVARYMGPKSVTGLDLSPKAVDFCRTHYRVPTLDFLQGHAEKLDFTDRSFDAVVNIESSHCYGSVAAFIREVHRVLRPGGHFLYSDYCDREALDGLRHSIRGAGFMISVEEDISANVLLALEMDDARKRLLINRKVPRILRGFFHEFAGLQGTRSYNSALRTGRKIYFRFVLKK